MASCRVCGCTDDKACEGGCYWVEPDLCSACVDRLEGILAAQDAEAQDDMRAKEEEHA